VERCDRVALAPPRHLRDIAHDLREPGTQRPVGLGPAAPCSDPRLLDQVVGVVGIPGERGREALQPRRVGQELLRIHVRYPAAAIANVDRNRALETTDPSGDKNCSAIASRNYERVVENRC
jgi:hypothetical protein